MAQPEIVKDIDARVKIPGDTMTGNLTAPTFIGTLDGNASSADKLNTNAGSLKQPVYFNNGKPVVAADNYVFYGEVSGTIPSDNSSLFVLKTGDTMTGNLRIENDSYPGILLKLPTTNRKGLIEVDPNGNLWIASRNDNSGQYSSLIIGTESTNLKDMLSLRVNNSSGNNLYSVYHTGNKPTFADIGAAPAGFGLGANSKYVSDWNNEKTNGWVRDPSGTEDRHSPFVGMFSVGLISEYGSGGDTFQLAFARNQYAKTRTYIKYRAYNGDQNVWGEWEWVNPPMELGVEYRTTERYQGKPVYVMTKDYGLVQEKNTEKIESVPENAGYGWVVNGEVTYYGIPIPSWNNDGTLRFGAQYAQGTGKIHFIANEDRVNTYAKYVLTIKYIKTTD